jgi:hypothetical protein
MVVVADGAVGDVDSDGAVVDFDVVVAVVAADAEDLTSR